MLRKVEKKYFMEFYVTSNELNVLNQSELFIGIDSAGISSLLSDFSFKTKHFSRNEVIAIQGDTYKGVLIVISGTASSEINDSTGKRVKLENFNKSAAIAPGILFALDNSLPVTITAVTDCSLIFIPKTELLTLLQKDMVFLENYLAVLGNKVNILADKIRLFKFNSIQQKIAGYLLNLYIKQQTEILTIPFTREQLADSFGVARPSLSRELSRMSDAGILIIEGKKIQILKKTALQYLLDGQVLE
jgi:CRP/FNR family transcriptional regulator, dissimilatory nitrate respiration regulator